LFSNRLFGRTPGAAHGVEGKDIPGRASGEEAGEPEHVVVVSCLSVELGNPKDVHARESGHCCGGTAVEPKKSADAGHLEED